MRWMLLKDLQILWRSKLLLGLLIVYPIAIATLMGFALSSGPEKPRVAFLNQVPGEPQHDPARRPEDRRRHVHRRAVHGDRPRGRREPRPGAREGALGGGAGGAHRPAGLHDEALQQRPVGRRDRGHLQRRRAEAVVRALDGVLEARGGRRRAGEGDQRPRVGLHRRDPQRRRDQHHRRELRHPRAARVQAAPGLGHEDLDGPPHPAARAARAGLRDDRRRERRPLQGRAEHRREAGRRATRPC